MQFDVEWRLRWEYGVQYKGGGLFIRSFWTEVGRCDVKPGFHVSVDFQTGHPQNEGQPNWPSALMGIQVSATIANER